MHRHVFTTIMLHGSRLSRAAVSFRELHSRTVYIIFTKLLLGRNLKRWELMKQAQNCVSYLCVL